jgi:hypothetical protein
VLLSASLLNMFPSQAVRTSPHIDGFLFQSDVFASFDCTPLSLGIIWRGVFLARSFEVLHKNRLPNFQGEIKMRGVMWDLLSQLSLCKKLWRTIGANLRTAELVRIRP